MPFSRTHRLLLAALLLPAFPASARVSISTGDAPGKPGTNMASGPEAYRDTVGGTRGSDRQAEPTMTMTDPKPKTQNAINQSPDIAGSGGTNSSAGNESSTAHTPPLNHRIGARTSGTGAGTGGAH